MKEKIIYSNWLAAELRKQGFPIVRTEINPRFPQFDCWVFEQTAEFDIAFGKLSQKRK